MARNRRIGLTKYEKECGDTQTPTINTILKTGKNEDKKKAPKRKSRKADLNVHHQQNERALGTATNTSFLRNGQKIGVI